MRFGYYLSHPANPLWVQLLLANPAMRPLLPLYGRVSGNAEEMRETENHQAMRIAL